jgi:DnaJ-class molecular chaperone
MSRQSPVKKRSLDQPKLQRRRNRDRSAQIAARTRLTYLGERSHATSNVRAMPHLVVCPECRGCWKGIRCARCHGTGRVYSREGN